MTLLSFTVSLCYRCEMCVCNDRTVIHRILMLQMLSEAGTCCFLWDASWTWWFLCPYVMSGVSLSMPRLLASARGVMTTRCLAPLQLVSCQSIIMLAYKDSLSCTQQSYCQVTGSNICSKQWLNVCCSGDKTRIKASSGSD